VSTGAAASSSRSPSLPLFLPLPILSPSSILRIFSTPAPSFCHSSPIPAPSTRPPLSLYQPASPAPPPFPPGEPSPPSLKLSPSARGLPCRACQCPADSSFLKALSRIHLSLRTRGVDKRGGRRRCFDVPAASICSAPRARIVLSFSTFFINLKES